MPYNTEIKRYYLDENGKVQCEPTHLFIPIEATTFEHEEHVRLSKRVAELEAVLASADGERTPLAPGAGTWSVFAEKVVAERDELRERVQGLLESNNEYLQRARNAEYQISVSISAQRTFEKLAYDHEKRVEALEDAARALAIDANRILERPRQGTYDDDLERSLRAVQKLLGMHVRGG